LQTRAEQLHRTDEERPHKERDDGWNMMNRDGPLCVADRECGEQYVAALCVRKYLPVTDICIRVEEATDCA
jgi:hypothetical protein